MSLYLNDDYAGVGLGNTSFYFGYESTWCALHGNDGQCDCEDEEWCFTATVNNKETYRLHKSQIEEIAGDNNSLDMPCDYLLMSMMIWINSKGKQPKKPKKPLSVCFSGFRDEKLEERILSKKGTVQDTVTPQTTILVVKDRDKNTTKKKTALSLGVPILELHELELLL